ncbi:hypothetical protein T11_12704 [Trichinella zimbabwensis]|uniref:Uncharacterized protein n=1 Tax=Trichinella zimbabwensis TaxID=268475 RepID=A0A0V1H7H7_9BILA|nr:hypothetical protein T11_12704 [Trichinella zimbabwensis]
MQCLSVEKYFPTLCGREKWQPFLKIILTVNQHDTSLTSVQQQLITLQINEDQAPLQWHHSLCNCFHIVHVEQHGNLHSKQVTIVERDR